MGVSTRRRTSITTKTIPSIDGAGRRCDANCSWDRKSTIVAEACGPASLKASSVSGTKPSSPPPAMDDDGWRLAAAAAAAYGDALGDPAESSARCCWASADGAGCVVIGCSVLALSWKPPGRAAPLRGAASSGALPAPSLRAAVVEWRAEAPCHCVGSPSAQAAARSSRQATTSSMVEISLHALCTLSKTSSSAWWYGTPSCTPPTASGLSVSRASHTLRRIGASNGRRRKRSRWNAQRTVRFIAAPTVYASRFHTAKFDWKIVPVRQGKSGVMFCATEISCQF